jgi:hypothetical protein
MRNNNKLIPGVVLVLIGTAFLLHNYDVVDFHWSNFFRLWPIFIVIAGVNLLFANNRSVWATVIKLTVIIAGFGIILFGNFGSRNHWPHIDIQVDGDDNNSSQGLTKIEGNSYFFESYNDTVRRAQLNISGGATEYILKDTTNQLFTADTKGFYGRYKFDKSFKDSVRVLDLRMNSGKDKFDWGNDHDENLAVVKLNTKPEWDIDVKTGASSLDFDLSKFKIRSLELNGGAAEFKVTLGQPLAISNIKVNTGVSEVNIRIPKDAACRIRKNSGLSSTDFQGFVKQKDKSYETPGFATAKNKYYINIQGGISEFNVTRY